MSGRGYVPEGADCLRVSGLLGLLVGHGLAVGDNPILIQDEDGAEYQLVEVTHETGDIALVLESPL